MAEGALRKGQDKSWISVCFRLLPVAFALILFSFFLFYDQSAKKFDENEAFAQAFVGLTVISSSVAGFALYKKDLLKTKTVVILLVVCGFALRLAYALKYGYNVHQLKVLIQADICLIFVRWPMETVCPIPTIGSSVIRRCIIFLRLCRSSCRICLVSPMAERLRIFSI